MSEESLRRQSQQGSALIKASMINADHSAQQDQAHVTDPNESQEHTDHRDQLNVLLGQPKRDETPSPNDEMSESSITEEEASRSGEEALSILKASRDLDRSNQLYRSGAYEEAARGYQELVSGLGEEKVLANLGYALQSLNRHEEAAQAFESYLKVFMARHHAWKALCFSYYHLEDYENMTRCAREAIRWDIRHDTPDDYSWQQMATAHFLMRDYSTALKAARKASALNPENPFSRYYEACVIAAFVDGEPCDEPALLDEPPSYEEAAELLADALEVRPDLEEELRGEGYLDRVFPLLESVRALRRARVLEQEQESSESSESPEPSEASGDESSDTAQRTS